MVPAAAHAQSASAKKPDISILWCDDIEVFNISAYNMGPGGG